jgi:XTP/dITP diphosphohydrolase
MPPVLFATSNLHKSDEASVVLSKVGIKITHFPFDHREIRSDSLEDIAREAAEEAYRRCAKPVFVEDAGLFIKAVDGFPGTYSAWAMRKIGVAGTLRLMVGAKDRSAYFASCIAFNDGSEVRIFEGRCDGAITEKAQGKAGFGYDPVFVPEGHSQTFAQNIELKNNLSHRYKSLLKFSRYLDTLK